MPHFKAVLAYDGTEFRGFQRLARGRTVQGELERALRRLGWVEKSVRAAGRTDAGVHAIGQVVAFELEWGRTPERLQAALNAGLPPDVSIREMAQVEASFHPRFSARRRRYRYTVRLAQERDPFRDRYAWQIWPAPEPNRLVGLARNVIGRRDFGGFGRPPAGSSHSVREVFRSEWTAGPGAEWVYVIEADAFLYHMVRRIVGAMVQVARGRRSEKQFEQSLRDPGQGWAGGLAPARGLSLDAVVFEDE